MFKSKEIIHIVAVDENMGIGKDGKLLYSIPNDLKLLYVFLPHNNE